MGDSVLDYCGLGNIVKGVKKRKTKRNLGDRRKCSSPSDDLMRSNESVHTLLSKLDIVEKKLENFDQRLSQTNNVTTSLAGANQNNQCSKLKVQLPDHWLGLMKDYENEGNRPCLEVTMSSETDYNCWEGGSPRTRVATSRNERRICSFEMSREMERSGTSGKCCESDLSKRPQEFDCSASQRKDHLGDPYNTQQCNPLRSLGVCGDNPKNTFSSTFLPLSCSNHTLSRNSPENLHGTPGDCGRECLESATSVSPCGGTPVYSFESGWVGKNHSGLDCDNDKKYLTDTCHVIDGSDMPVQTNKAVQFHSGSQPNEKPHFSNSSGHPSNKRPKYGTYSSSLYDSKFSCPDCRSTKPTNCRQNNFSKNSFPARIFRGLIGSSSKKPNKPNAKDMAKQAPFNCSREQAISMLQNCSNHKEQIYPSLKPFQGCNDQPSGQETSNTLSTSYESHFKSSVLNIPVTFRVEESNNNPRTPIVTSSPEKDQGNEEIKNCANPGNNHNDSGRIAPLKSCEYDNINYASRMCNCPLPHGPPTSRNDAPSPQEPLKDNGPSPQGSPLKGNGNPSKDNGNHPTFDERSDRNNDNGHTQEARKSRKSSLIQPRHSRESVTKSRYPSSIDSSSDQNSDKGNARKSRKSRKSMSTRPRQSRKSVAEKARYPSSIDSSSDQNSDKGNARKSRKSRKSMSTRPRQSRKSVAEKGNIESSADSDGLSNQSTQQESTEEPTLKDAGQDQQKGKRKKTLIVARHPNRKEIGKGNRGRKSTIHKNDEDYSPNDDNSSEKEPSPKGSRTSKFSVTQLRRGFLPSPVPVLASHQRLYSALTEDESETKYALYDDAHDEDASDASYEDASDDDAVTYPTDKEVQNLNAFNRPNSSFLTSSPKQRRGFLSHPVPGAPSNSNTNTNNLECDAHSCTSKVPLRNVNRNLLIGDGTVLTSHPSNRSVQNDFDAVDPRANVAPLVKTMQNPKTLEKSEISRARQSGSSKKDSANLADVAPLVKTMQNPKKQQKSEISLARQSESLKNDSANTTDVVAPLVKTMQNLKKQQKSEISIARQSRSSKKDSANPSGGRVYHHERKSAKTDQIAGNTRSKELGRNGNASEIQVRVSDSERQRIHELARKNILKRSLSRNIFGKPSVSPSIHSNDTKNNDLTVLSAKLSWFSAKSESSNCDSYCLNAKYLNEPEIPFVPDGNNRPEQKHSVNQKSLQKFIVERVIHFNRHTREVEELAKVTDITQGYANAEEHVSDTSDHLATSLEPFIGSKPEISAESFSTVQHARSTDSPTQDGPWAVSSDRVNALLRETFLRLYGPELLEKDKNKRNLRDHLFYKISTYDDAEDQPCDIFEDIFADAEQANYVHSRIDERMETLLKDSVARLSTQNSSDSFRNDTTCVNSHQDTKRSIMTSGNPMATLPTEYLNFNNSDVEWEAPTDVHQGHHNTANEDLKQSIWNSNFIPSEAPESDAVVFEPTVESQLVMALRIENGIRTGRKFFHRKSKLGLQKASEIMDLLEIYPGQSKQVNPREEKTRKWIEKINIKSANKEDRVSVKAQAKQNRKKNSYRRKNSKSRRAKKGFALSKADLYKSYNVRVPAAQSCSSASTSYALPEPMDNKREEQKFVVYMNEGGRLFKHKCKHGFSNHLPKKPPLWFRDLNGYTKIVKRNSRYDIKPEESEHKPSKRTAVSGHHHHSLLPKQRSLSSDDSVNYKQDSTERKGIVREPKKRETLERQHKDVQVPSRTVSISSTSSSSDYEHIGRHVHNVRHFRRDDRSIKFAHDHGRRGHHRHSKDEYNRGSKKHKNTHNHIKHARVDRPNHRHEQPQKSAMKKIDLKSVSSDLSSDSESTTSTNSSSSTIIIRRKHNSHHPHHDRHHVRNNQTTRHVKITNSLLAAKRVKLKKKVPHVVTNYRQRLVTADSKPSSNVEKANVKDFIDFLATLSRNTISSLTNKKKTLKLYRDFLTSPRGR